MAEVLLRRAEALVEVSLGDSDILDMKAVTLLTADIAALSLLIPFHHPHSHVWWIAAALMVVAGLFFYQAIQTREYKVAQKLPTFRERNWGASPREIYEAMFVELQDVRTDTDNQVITKHDQFQRGYIALGATMGMALLQTVV